MHGKRPILLYGLLLAAATIIAPGCAMLQEAGLWKNPRVNISGIRLTALDFERAGLDIFLNITNPNPYPVTLGLLDYTLTVQDRQVLTGRQNNSTSLGAGRSREIVFPVQVRFADLRAAVSELKNRAEVTYDLAGGLNFAIPVSGTIAVPFRKQGKLPVPKMPKISVEGLKLEDSHLLGATLKLALALENPNAFGVDLKRLTYTFRLNQTTIARGRPAESLSVAPGATSRLVLPLELSFGNTGMALFNLLQNGGNLNYSLKLDGKADTTHELLQNIPLQTEKTGSIQLRR